MKKFDFPGDDRLRIGRALALAIKYWWIYLISVGVMLGLGALYVKIKSPVFEVSGAIAINEEESDKGGISGQLGALMSTFSLGGGGSKNTDDEIFRMTSAAALKEVVMRTGIWFSAYDKPGLLSRKVLYYKDSPFRIELPVSVLDTLRTTTAFSISGKATEWKLKAKQNGKTVAEKVLHSFPASVRTPIGIFSVDTTGFFSPSEPMHFKALVESPLGVALQLRKDLDMNTESKKSDIVWIGIDEANIAMAEAIVNAVIDVYIENTLGWDRQKAEQNLKYLDARLEQTYADLLATDTEIEAFKTKHNIVDPAAEAEYIYKLKVAGEENRVELETKSALFRLILDFMENPENRYSAIPFTVDMPGEPIEAYNELAMQRMKLAAGLKGSTKALEVANSQMDAIRSTMIATVRSHLMAADGAIKSIDKVSDQADARISQAPMIEKELIDMTRDQKVKSTVYAYLLQRREQAALKVQKDVPVVQTIDRAFTPVKPKSPKKWLVFGGAFLAGILLAYEVVRRLSVSVGSSSSRSSL